MKKILFALLIAIFSLLLLLMSGSALASYQTPQVKSLKTFVENSKDLKDTPITNANRDLLTAELATLVNSAKSSCRDVFNKRETIIKERAAKKLEQINLAGERALFKGQEKINAWLKQNQDVPGASEKAQKMLEKLTQKIQRQIKNKTFAVKKSEKALLRANQKRFNISTKQINKLEAVALLNISLRPQED